MEYLIKRHNKVNSEYINNDNLKAKRIKARLKYRIIKQARAKGISLYSDSFNYLYQETEYKEIQETYKNKNFLYVFKVNKIV